VSIAKPIRVLHVIRQGLIGGGESHVLTLVDKLDDKTVSSYVLSFTDGPMVQQLRAMNVPVHVIPIKNALDWRLYSGVRKFLIEEQIDLIHAHGSRACAFIIILARILKIKVIYTIHGWSFHPSQSALINFLRRKAESIITQLTTLNICVSDSNLLTGKSLYKGFKAKVVKNGIDIQKFSISQMFRDYRMEWEVPSNAKLILYAARMTIQKQPIVALEAFEFIAKQIPDIFMVMVGDGELLDEVREKIQTLSSKDRIRLKSFYTDMPGVYHASDIFILPSLWEGLPIALLEAMSMGKVVVASAVDGTKELIQHRHNGLLIDVSDSISRKLGRSIVEVVSDQFLFKELSSQAIKTVEIDYNSVIMANKIKDIYQECLIC
jgi:glycosyltransferase involved in cell wall biosynthesis